MFELYFIFYRIPKMMGQLARERNRSAVKWSLLGIAAWIGGEVLVALGFGIAYGVGAIFFGWPEQPGTGANVLLYVVALAAAIGSFALVRRILYSMSAHPTNADDRLFTPPPPPPSHF